MGTTIGPRPCCFVMPPEQFYAATARRPNGRSIVRVGGPARHGVFGADSRFGVHDRGSQPGHGVEELVLHVVGDVVSLLHSQGELRPAATTHT